VRPYLDHTPGGTTCAAKTAKLYQLYNELQKNHFTALVQKRRKKQEERKKK